MIQTHFHSTECVLIRPQVTNNLTQPRTALFSFGFNYTYRIYFDANIKDFLSIQDTVDSRYRRNLEKAVYRPLKSSSTIIMLTPHIASSCSSKFCIYLTSM